jgi:hypothetical protein
MLIKTKTSLINFANVLNISKYFDKHLDFYGGAGRIESIEFLNNEKRNEAFKTIIAELQAGIVFIDISDFQS